MVHYAWRMRWCIVHEPYAPSYEPQKRKRETKKRGNKQPKKKKKKKKKQIESRTDPDSELAPEDKTSQLVEG